MAFSEIFGLFLALFVGISLGLLGSGGSILSMPILVYVLQIEPVLATAYSLFVVGCTALVGGVQKAKQKLVDFQKVILFGIPTVLAVFATRFFVMPNIPNIIYFTSSISILKSVLVLMVFAIVMIFASFKMIRPIPIDEVNSTADNNYFKIIMSALLIGVIAGFVGAGGGFLIIPALLFLTNTPMKIAVGTSLFIVAIQSLLGFLGDYNSFILINWPLLLKFTGCAIIGLFIGNRISLHIAPNKLKVYFGYFILCMGIYIIIKEVVMA